MATSKIITNFGVVNRKLHILFMMLGMMTLMPGICFSRSSEDSLLLHRIWDYYSNFAQDLEGTQHNVYMVYKFNVERRNALLTLVPSMHSIARGNRHFVGEAYCKLKYGKDNKYDLQRQVVWGTIPRNRKVMPAMLEFMTPNIYDITLYPNRLLSPFYYANRLYYRYSVSHIGGDLSIVRYRPRINNTQLVTGHAVVSSTTGRIQSIVFEGEYDMIRFNVTALMNIQHPEIALPERCTTTASFKFLGNRIKSIYSAYYNCPTTLPDSIQEITDRLLMEKLRPTPLLKEEKEIYKEFDDEHSVVVVDTVKPSKFSKFKDKVWDIIGENVISTQYASAGPLAMRISPLLNPLYFAYSPAYGVAYRLNAGIQYTINPYRFFMLNPDMGYNFKLRQFYYFIPLRFFYDLRYNAFVEVDWGNGNRIASGKMIEDILTKIGPINVIPEYRDEFVQVYHNILPCSWLNVRTGFVYHLRRAFNQEFMQTIGIPGEYRSFAPMATIHFSPWKNGPMLTANYERSIKDVLGSNLNYERWEFDAAYKKKIQKLRVLSLRGGIGFYTHRSTEYFVDYINFRDNNLPTGWDDEWTGQFQLLNSQWYNQSDYYVRAHFTYDSPLLALSWVPYVGRLIETERVYASALSIQHQKFYYELGYGFTNRFFSTGIFASFLGMKYNQLGFKFTIHIFNRW